MTLNSEGSNNRKVSFIGVPLGFGAGKSGSELGVEAVRHSFVRGKRLLGHIEDLGISAEDLGNVQIVTPSGEDAAERVKARHLSEMTRSCENIFKTVEEIMDSGSIPLIVGGDHSIAIGTFSGVASHCRKHGNEVGLLWFDAHADINTPETSGSGNIHGMPLAILLGEGPPDLVQLGGFAPKLNKKYFAHVGARDLDRGERTRINDLGLRDQFFTMSEIDKRGMPACVEQAIDIVSAAPGGYSVTFDVDVIDPRFAPGSGTLVRGGATYREAHLALEIIAERGGMRSFEIVEVNPLLDQSNITVELAVELMLSALGKTIL